MLENKGNFKLNQYSIDLSAIVDPLCHLLIEISNLKKTEQSFHETIHQMFFLTDFDNGIIENDTIEEDDFIIELNKVIINKIMNDVAFFKNTGTLLLFKDKNILLSNDLEAKEIKNTLISFVKSKNPIGLLFDLIKIDALKIYKTQFIRLIHDASLSQIVKINSSQNINSHPIACDILNRDNISSLPIDEESVWVNERLFSKKYKIDIKPAKPTDISEFFISNKSIGIKIGDNFIPFDDINMYVKEENSIKFVWELFSYIYVENTIPRLTSDPEIIIKFKDQIKDERLNNLLSFLVSNLYINTKDGAQIPELYKDFFEEVYQIGNLDHLNQYSFYTSSDSVNQHSVLGIYSNSKSGSEYNLLHWIRYNEDSNKHPHYRSINPVKKELPKVYALLPEISFYFASKYFEDMFKQILENIEVDFLFNFNLYNKGIPDIFMEIDFLIKKSIGFLFIETKTKLTKYYIEDTISKFSKLHNVLKITHPNINIEYALIAPYCDSNIESYKYFIDMGKIEERNNVNNKIHSFDIPIPQFENLMLTCLVEPAFNKLEDKINQLCQK